jgi:hypothetical protein
MSAYLYDVSIIANGEGYQLIRKYDDPSTEKTFEVTTSLIRRVKREDGRLVFYTENSEYKVNNAHLIPNHHFSGARVARYALIAYHKTASSRAKEYLRSYITQQCIGDKNHQLWIITVDIPHVMEGGGNVPLAITRNSRPNPEALKLYD